jgi:BirA family biotin operon repressor/biotin-[acetyl-CoA-carboxylase] ligase
MIGRPHVHHAVTDSTNERAKELARAGAPHGTLVTADEQTAGRGRQGRAWVAPAGTAVLMSVVVREFDALLPLRAPVWVFSTLECEASLEPKDAGIKWPNDIWIGDRKLAGILVEGNPQEEWAVVGVGLNIWTEEHEFPPDLRDTATSLAIAQSGSPDIELMVEYLVGNLETWLQMPQEDVVDEWRVHDVLLGRAISWESGSGTAAGIDDSGALLVDTAEGQVALQAGEVHLTL